MERTMLSGDGLDVDTVVRVARDPGIEVACTEEALRRVDAAHRLVMETVERYERGLADPRGGPPAAEYGITTGFGEFKDFLVHPAELARLQRNLISSHAVGVGDSPDAEAAGNHYSAEVVRATMLLRLNTFLRGNSGVSVELVDTIALMLNAGIVPRVPLRGSVGSSGDLAPLAHLYGVLLGHGGFTVVRDRGDLHRTDLPVRSAAVDLPPLLGRDAAELVGLIGPKAGLALTNGAAVCAAMLALGAHDARRLAEVADGAAALTLEAVCGSARAFDPEVHRARPHPGQITSAGRIRALVTGSSLVESSDAVQDAYSVRCAPQVHGASRHAIDHVLEVAHIEINSSTDNPLLFPGHDRPWDIAFEANLPPGRQEPKIAFSAGNFHGQPIALAADYLTIALAELADVSERRTQMLLDSHHNRGLPANLIGLPGLNSGLMITQYAAAGLVSENKVLAHPASVDSIPTSANSEDHVAMANHAARKALRVLANVQAVLAIELIAAVQAIDWRAGVGVRAVAVPPASSGGRQEALAAHQAAEAAFAAATGPEHVAGIAAKLGDGTGVLYTAVRSVVAPLVADRTLDADIRAVWNLIRDETLNEAVRRFAGEPSEEDR
ncbi:histidine ammonia-lyase [Spirillospora sp. NPDC050679]